LTILGHRLKDGVRVETSFGDPDMLECYPSLLNQALMNLLSNAIDAIGRQGTIRIVSGTEQDAYHISVADDGPGIRDQDRDRVFEPFFTTKPVGEGTGLGLSIAYSIVRKHGGALELAPVSTGGTIATISIPLNGATGV
jgi:two-component system NtrC family sensor kinase